MATKQRFKLSSLALLDLEEIGDYIARDSVEQSVRVLRQLREHMNKIAAMPGIGRARTELCDDDSIAFWPALHYLIIYYPNTSPVEIIRVLHTSRNVRTLLGET